jgi:hypothetical protein
VKADITFYKRHQQTYFTFAARSCMGLKRNAKATAARAALSLTIQYPLLCPVRIGDMIEAKAEALNIFVFGLVT